MALRTVVYVDGFNLYYGCLKPLPHCRWLDIAAFSDHFISEATSSPFEITQIKYFTAPILSNLSPHGDKAMVRQSGYWRALEIHSKVEVIKGYFYPAQGEYFADLKPLDMERTHRVIRPEEKQTDVNLALHMLLDAQKDYCDQQVLISNDSDYEAVFRIIKEHYPKQILGWIPPILDFQEENYDRQPNSILKKHSHWSHYPIREEKLLELQLPDKVSTVTKSARIKRTKTFFRPEYWSKK